MLRKCAHMTEYAMLALLLLRATGSYAWAFAAAVAYACTDEFHQTFVRGRHGSPVDVAIDALGALIGLTLLAPGAPLDIGPVEHGEVADRQLEALLERLDRIAEELRAAERARGAPRGADRDRARAAQPERVAAGDRLRGARHAGPAGPAPPRRLNCPQRALPRRALSSGLTPDTSDEPVRG